MKKILLMALVMVFCLVVVQPTAYSNPLKGVKDKLIKKFANCYKKSEKMRKKCVKMKKGEMKSLEKEKQKVIKNSKKKGQTDRAYWAYGKELESMDKNLAILAEQYDACKDKAEQLLLNCRLDKKKFKSGCDEKEMDGKLKALNVKANAVREKYGSCTNSCRVKFINAYEKAGKKLAIGYNDSVPLIDKYEACTSKCKSKFRKAKSENEKSMQKKRYKILAECINTGK